MVDPAHFVSSHKTPLVFFSYRFRGSKRPDVHTHLAANCGPNSFVYICMYVYISYSPAESFKKIDTFYEVTLRYTVKYTQSTLM